MNASTGTMCGVTWKSVVACDPCAARKGPRKRTRGRLQLYNVGEPFKQIAFDILGPLPKSSDGNNILVVMGYFTKWPEAYISYSRPRGLDCCRGSSSTLELTIPGPSTTALRSREKLRFCSLQETV
ncbi:retrovirus-related Pol polyprotein from transposon 412 [Trichonephila clavipes]|nr:retrovirus-related Pol polyprotein from transposon 412 [Trichonephila clavipes]